MGCCPAYECVWNESYECQEGGPKCCDKKKTPKPTKKPRTPTPKPVSTYIQTPRPSKGGYGYNPTPKPTSGYGYNKTPKPTTLDPTKTPSCPNNSESYGYSDNPCNGYSKECCPAYECVWNESYECQEGGPK